MPNEFPNFNPASIPEAIKALKRAKEEILAAPICDKELLRQLATLTDSMDRLAEQLSNATDQQSMHAAGADFKRRFDEFTNWRSLNEFIDKGVVSFKRVDGWSIIEAVPYCPKCHTELTDSDNGLLFVCPKCNHSVKGEDIWRLADQTRNDLQAPNP
jgi:predicted RNA-binding Zn-ribbon protein involved in translation (DUF1610 family)